jgi:hypothetical protein
VASRGAQMLAAGSIAVSLILVAAGHTLSTTRPDPLAWVVILLLVGEDPSRRHERWCSLAD